AVIDTPLSAMLRYVDANGNLDIDADTTMNGESVTVTRSDSGVILAGASATVSAGVASFTNIRLGTPTQPGGGLKLRFADSAGSQVVVTTVAESTDITLVGHVTSTLTSSLGYTTLLPNNTFQDVWRVAVNDTGSDGVATFVNSITFNVGVSTARTATNFAWQLVGDSTISTISNPAAFTVGASSVTVTLNGLLTVGDGASKTLTLRARIQETDSVDLDGVALTLAADPDDIVTLNTGSRMVGGATINAPSSLTVNVIATKMRFLGAQPSSTMTGATIGASLEFTDANGNRDLSITENVTANWSGAGTESNNVVAAMAGVANFGAAGFAIAEPGDLNGVIGFSDDAGVAGDLLDISINPFSLIDSDDADALIALSGTPVSVLNSNAGPTTVFGFRVSDPGRSDGLNTTLTALTLVATVSAPHSVDD
ncbi:MAG: hypothetical protein KDB07_12560, partial [Planctomycetes bacterium]|nr:hypothetical protein [Planctomycetota bacterium]